MSSAVATRRSPMEATLSSGTITEAPSSSRVMRTSSSRWPAMSFCSSPITRQTPWFG